MYNFLLSNQESCKGWIRDVIAFGDDDLHVSDNRSKKKLLNEKENYILTMMISLFIHASSSSGVYKGYTNLVYHSFGLAHNTFKRKINRFLDSNYDFKKLERKDKGQDVFNS